MTPQQHALLADIDRLMAERIQAHGTADIEAPQPGGPRGAPAAGAGQAQRQDVPPGETGYQFVVRFSFRHRNGNRYSIPDADLFVSATGFAEATCKLPAAATRYFKGAADVEIHHLRLVNTDAIHTQWFIIQ